MNSNEFNIISMFGSFVWSICPESPAFFICHGQAWAFSIRPSLRLPLFVLVVDLGTSPVAEQCWMLHDATRCYLVLWWKGFGAISVMNLDVFSDCFELQPSAIEPGQARMRYLSNLPIAGDGNSATACYCMLLHATACYCMLLHATAISISTYIHLKPIIYIQNW